LESSALKSSRKTRSKLPLLALLLDEELTELLEELVVEELDELLEGERPPTMP